MSKVSGFELNQDQLSQARVLLVDDEPMVTSSLRTFLDLELDINAVTFNDPAQALNYVAEHPVDLVISDFLMPHMDGLHFLVEVQRQQPAVPRVLLTGYADKKNAIRAINQVRLFRYIQKPWDNQHLKDVVVLALRHLHRVRQMAARFEEMAETREDYRELPELLLKAFA